WVGVGWDLTIPHIEVDTRFGVPEYDGNERYLLNGAALVPGATTGTERTYFRRVEGAFERIVRRGTTATDFEWEVTDQHGTKFFYGSSNPAYPGPMIGPSESRLTDVHASDPA